MKKFKVFTEVLAAHGYFVGYTGKPWGPGNWEISGRKQNPVGKAYNRHQLTDRPTEGIRANDYAQNFKDFYNQKEEGNPFVFWYGAFEPHRVYEYQSGIKAGKNIDMHDWIFRYNYLFPSKEYHDYAGNRTTHMYVNHGRPIVHEHYHKWSLSFEDFLKVQIIIPQQSFNYLVHNSSQICYDICKLYLVRNVTIEYCRERIFEAIAFSISG